MTEDDLTEFKVLEFIEVEPDKLVWDDVGTGTWMNGPSVCFLSELFESMVRTFYCPVFDHVFFYLFGPVR